MIKPGSKAAGCLASGFIAGVSFYHIRNFSLLSVLVFLKGSILYVIRIADIVMEKTGEYFVVNFGV